MHFSYYGRKELKILIEYVIRINNEIELVILSMSESD